VSAYEAVGTLVAAQLFSLEPSADGTLALKGEVDVASADALAAALRASARDPWVVDVAGLDFLDVAGMRAIALTSERAGVPLQLVGTPAWLTRLWQVAGFHRAAPAVVLSP
jgi:anti-anti-sigma factor